LKSINKKEGIQTPANLSLKQRISFLLKDSALYGGSDDFCKAFGLITLPFLALHLSVAYYWLIDLF
jgi:hypothetical protein